MDTYASMLQIGILFFVSFIIIEWIAGVLMKKPVHRAIDTVSSLSSGLTNTIKDILKLTVVIVSYEWSYQHLALLELDTSWWLYVIAFSGIDFAAYWSHRWNHEFNLLWNRHIIHHSSEEFNLAAALRQSISGIFGIFFFLYLPLAVLGVPPKVIAIMAPLHLFAQFWYHTQLIGRMGVLEHIIVTPSHHRVHHAINPEYIDKNYAAIFIFWDKWFGTFQEELADVPPVYGVKKAVKTWNPFLINFMHLWQLIKDAWRTQSWKDKLLIWVKPTGWRPADVAEAYPIEVITRAEDQVKYNPPASKALILWAMIQLTVHTLMQFHLIEMLAEAAYVHLLIYGIFLYLSIFAYTTLLDRHVLAVPFEAVKLIAGAAMLVMFEGWFTLDQLFPRGSIWVEIYLASSMGMTLYFTFIEKNTPAQMKVAG
ncbi:MAG: sterol desaturase family protein [Bacteroidota bacterium]